MNQIYKRMVFEVEICDIFVCDMWIGKYVRKLFKCKVVVIYNEIIWWKFKSWIF